MSNQPAPIYSFYGPPIAIPGDIFNFSYNCNLCKKDKRSRLGTDSNLVSHIRKIDHASVLVEYEKLHVIYQKLKPNTPTRSINKRIRYDSANSNASGTQMINAASSQLSQHGFTNTKTPTKKYPRNGQAQKEHYNNLVSMFIKCMLPISTIEHPSNL